MPAATVFPPLFQHRRRDLAGRIEALEQRVVPAAIVTHWVGGSGDWTDPAHWDNGVPNNANGNTYTAIIDASPLDPVVMLTSDIQVSTLTNYEAIQVDGGHTSVLTTLNNNGAISIGAGGFFSLESSILGMTTAKLGEIHVMGGVFQTHTNIDNTGSTLTIDAPSGSWQLEKALIKGGIVNATAGSKLTVSSTGANNVSALDGVTLNADLALAGTNFVAAVDILNALTLNGTATLGNKGYLNFVGTQTLAGTGSVVFDEGINGIIQSNPAPVLTIGAGITIHGGSSPNGGQIGSNFQRTASDGKIINEGTISADLDGKSLALFGSALVNHGTIEGKTGGLMVITNLSTSSGTLSATAAGAIAIKGFHWTNTGTINSSSSTVFLDGVFTTAGLGSTNFNSGKIVLKGALENAGATLNLNTAAGWFLDGGAVYGGTVQSNNGSGLLMTPTGGLLDGVTMNADLNLTYGTEPSKVEIRHGLTLNGNAGLGAGALLNFNGTQTLGGTGTVYFTDVSKGALIQTGTTPVLTIGSGVVIRGGATEGQGGWIGRSPEYGGATDGTIINQGRISADLGDRSLTVNAGALVNSGTIEGGDATTVILANLVQNSGTFQFAHGTLVIGGDHWTNTGTINLNTSNLVLGGTFTAAGLGTPTFTNSAVYLLGDVENVGKTLTLFNGASWNLYGGTIFGGTVQGPSPLTLTKSGGDLVGVTLNTNLLAGGGDTLAGADIYGGLRLNGTVAMGQNSVLNFYGTQTFDGQGHVIFADASNSTLRIASSGSTLTLGAELSITGGSTQEFGARIGYSDKLLGPTDITVVNHGLISGDTGTPISILQGRFLNVGDARAIGALNAPAAQRAESFTLSKTNSPYVYQDANGVKVTARWTGAGSAELVRILGQSGPAGNLFSVTTHDSNLTSSLSLVTTGIGATTSVERIEIIGSLKALTAPGVNLFGQVTSTNSVGTLLLGDATGAIVIGPRATGDTKTMTSLTFDQVANLQIASATPLLAVTAAQWLDRDATADVITAPSLGSLTVKAALTRGFSPDFEADLNLTGAGVAPKALTLGRAAVSGIIASADWAVTGNVGAIVAGSTTADWSTHFSGSLVSLTTAGRAAGDLHIGARAVGDLKTKTLFNFDTASELSIHSLMPIASLTTRQWIDRDATPDVLSAPSLGVLAVKGDTRPTRFLAGDFEADVAISAAGLASTAIALGPVTVKGKIDDATWTVGGPVSAITAGSTGTDWDATFTRNIASLTASTLSGSLQALSIGTVKADQLTQLDLTLTLPAFPGFRALGTLTVKNAIDSSTIRAAGDIGTVTAAEIKHSRLFAGVSENVSFLPSGSLDFTAASTIAKLVVSGVARSTDPGLLDSFIAASKITSASITRFAPANGGTGYGLSADAIATLTLKAATSTTTLKNLGNPLADASGGSDDFLVRIV